MAVKAKTGATRVDHQAGKPKLTRQGQGAAQSPTMGARSYAAKVAAERLPFSL